MNKKLLLFGTTLLMSVAAFAQWTKPVPASTASFKVSVESDTTFYYLYNKDAQAFFTEGNAWGTQASIGAPALKIFFSQYLVNNAWDGKTYLINDYSLAKKAWNKLFIDSETSMFVDLGSQKNYMWEIADQGENVYRIVGADVNPEFKKSSYESCYMGYDQYAGVSITGALTPFLNVDDVVDGHKYCVDWQLVVPDDYNAISTQLLNYYSATALKTAIDSASVHNTDINLAGINAVYDNSTSTKVELDSVKNSLNSAITLSLYIASIATTYPSVDASAAKAVLAKADFSPADISAASTALKSAVRLVDVLNIIGGATVDNPKSATSLLTNPDFSTGNINGWTCNYTKNTNVTNIGYQSATYTNGDVTINKFIEAWANAVFNKNVTFRSLGNGSVYQNITGLPAGKYVFSCDAISSNQDGHDVSGASLYAKGGDLTFKTAIITGNKKPEHFEISFISTGGDIQFGFMTENTTANWLACDNFTLTYYGEIQDDPYKVILDEHIAQLNKTYPDMDVLKAYSDVKSDYSSVLVKVSAATEDYQKQDSILTVAANVLAASVAEYKSFATLMSQLQAKQTKFETDPAFSGISDRLGDLYMEWEEKYNDCTATSEYIAAAEDNMGKIIIDYITDNLKDGDEITALITNADFATNFSGWSTTGASPAFGGVGGNGSNVIGDVAKLTNGNAECYHAAFNMFQIIRNMPKGSFTLTCQAFERNDGGYVNYWTQGPEAGINATLYANDFSSKINSILAFSTTDMLYQVLKSDGTNEWTTDVSTDYGYVPNSMDGANFHFASAGTAYQVNLNFTLPEAGDSIKIGLKTSGTNSWIIFDNFRLIYKGSGVEAYRDAINSLVDKLNTVFTNATFYGFDAKDKVDNVIPILTAALAGTDGDACISAINQGNAALDYAKTSIADYTALNEVYSSLSETLETYQETATEDVVSAAVNALDEVEATLDKQDLTNEEAEALAVKAKSYISALKVPNTAGASFEKPINVSSVIVNATFDTIDDFTGWSGSGFGSGGTKSTNAERYSMNYDTYQDIAGLPAGYYIAKMQGYYRRGTASNDYALQISAMPDTLRNAFYYGVSSVDSAKTYLKATSSAALLSSDAESFTTNGTASVGDGYVIPNFMITATDWFNQGYYWNQFTVQVGDNGTLRLGVKNNATITDDWSIFDNFQLYYVGKTIPTAIGTVETVDKIEVVSSGMYNLAGQKLSAPQKGINIINGKKYFVK